MHADLVYRNLLSHILEHGTDKGDRTGTGTRSVFGYQCRFDLQEGFPLLTTKRMFWKGVKVELMWFLKGRTDLRYLLENNVHIWSANARAAYQKDTADPKTGKVDQITIEDFEALIAEPETLNSFNDQHGDLGPVYGKQWRNWSTYRETFLNSSAHSRPTFGEGQSIDQLQQCVTRLRENPDSRRHVVVAWNPADIQYMALPPCHCLFQFYSRPMNREALLTSAAATLSGKSKGAREHLYKMTSQELSDHCEQLGAPRRFLDCQMYQRSADVFLGVPFNIASYALLCHMVAQVTEHVPGEFIHTFGDVHLYNNHFKQAREQIEREPFPMPRVELVSDAEEIDDFTLEEIKLTGYEHHPAIRAKMSV